MSDSVKNSIWWSIALITFVYALKSMVVQAAPLAVAQVLKISHTAIENKKLLEAGNLTLHFSSLVLPQIGNSVALSNGWEKQDVFFEATVNRAVLNDVLTTLNQTTTSAYRIKIKKGIFKGKKGLTCTIEYNPNVIGIVYESVNNMQGQPGVVIRFIYIELQKNLKDLFAIKPVIRTAYTTKNYFVVIDPGHGGLDPGALGLNNSIEKDISLSVSLQVAQILRKKGCKVYCTRTADTTLSLQERAWQTNRRHPDLFVSIHANAAPRRQASGIETFYKNLREKKWLHTSVSINAQRMAALEKQLKEQSITLASSIQNNLYNFLVEHNPYLVNRGIKPALFQVLLNVQKPAVLVEIGFISHPGESLLLQTSSYQKNVAKGIAQGILSYLYTIS